VGPQPGTPILQACPALQPSRHPHDDMVWRPWEEARGWIGSADGAWASQGPFALGHVTLPNRQPSRTSLGPPLTTSDARLHGKAEVHAQWMREE
jgi:hypothetical protein